MWKAIQIGEVYNKLQKYCIELAVCYDLMILDNSYLYDIAESSVIVLLTNK